MSIETKDTATSGATLRCGATMSVDGPPAWSDDAIRARIADFDKWFVHTDFGGGVVARSTSWPDAPARSRHMGVSKWEFIIRRNLPDLQGKRVLDLGCNNGLMAIHMARQGAREVVGIDSMNYWPRWKEQADFVKSALEWRCQTTYNTRYLELEMKDLPDHELGRFDIVTAFNSFYYLEASEMERVTRHLSTVADVFLVQCNTADHPSLHPRPTPKFVEAILRKCGFPTTHMDWPWDRPRRGLIPRRYWRPVVVGHRR